MKSITLRIFFLVLIAGLILLFVSPVISESEIPQNETDQTSEEEPSTLNTNALSASYMPIFRFPVVPGVVISGYFDHNPSARMVTHYNGNKNNGTGYGYYFSCSSSGMYDFVGCQYNVTGEAACPNEQEVWYDGHKGTDYEFSPNWHTGATCDPGRFSGLTKQIYAPAAGKVQFAGYNAARPGNGWHVLMKHDLNGNGSYEDDNLRTFFLHFTPNALAVYTNQIIGEGQYLGLGGTSGYSSTPHLHFEVQRSNDNFTYTSWSVDPYGWSGAGADPWPYANNVLWRYSMTHHLYLPSAMNLKGTECHDCGDILRNSGFESGRVDWVENGVDIVTSTSNPRLPVAPFDGNWLAWLGGRNYAVDSLYQQFTVPQGITEAKLSYYIRKSTDETGNTPYDSMYVRLRTSSGDLIQLLDYVDNTFSPNNQWIRREVSLPVLADRQGEQLRISFEAATDSNLVTNFYVDEVIISGNLP
jgi:hypothetical protein